MLSNPQFVIKGADGLPYLDLFHGIDTLLTVQIQNKVIFQRPIGKRKKKRFKYITETITEDSDDEECINSEENAFCVFKID